MIIASLPGYEVIKLLGAEILSFMKQYSYNLINWERSDHNLISRCLKLVYIYMINQSLHISSVPSWAHLVPCFFGHIARYAPSKKETNCIPIEHTWYKLIFNTYLTFNFRKYRKLNYFITLSFITWEQSDHHLIRFIVPMAALGATSPGLFFPTRRLFWNSPGLVAPQTAICGARQGKIRRTKALCTKLLQL